MSDDAFATLCSLLICLGVWGGFAAAGAALAQWRVRRVEANLGRRAEPSEEAVQLFYAGASVVYLGAAILALVGLAKKDWARTGRNCLFFFIGHITLVIAGMPFVLAQSGREDAAAVVPILILACVIVGLSLLVASYFAVRWSALRTRRIEALPATGTEPLGAVRYVIYFGSLAIWPVGLVCAAVLKEPENVRVGATSFRLSLANFVGVGALVCIALPFVASSL